MGTMPRLVSVLLLGLGVAVVGCTTANSNVKDKTTFKGDNHNPTFAVNKDTTAKQGDNNSQFQTQNPAGSMAQTTTGTSNFGDPAPMGARPLPPATVANDNHPTIDNRPFNPPPPSPTAMGNPPSVVLPPRPTGDAQLTTQQPADTMLHVGYGAQSMHTQEADRIPTTIDVAPSSPQGTPLPPIVVTSGSTQPLPPAPVQVPPLPATTSNFNAPPALPPLPGK